MSRVQKILQTMKDSKNTFNMKTTKYVPIYNFDSYMRNKIKYDLQNVTSEENKLFHMNNHRNIIQNQYTCECPPETKNIEKITDDVCDFDTVKVVLNITKNKKVKLKLVQPHVFLHDCYFSKATLPPLEEYILNLKYAGYSKYSLERFISVYKQREKKKSEIKKYIETIMGKKK